MVEGEPPRRALIPEGTIVELVRSLAPAADRIELGVPSDQQLLKRPELAASLIGLRRYRLKTGGEAWIKVDRSEVEPYLLALDQVANVPWASLVIDDSGDPDGQEILRVGPKRIDRMVLTRDESRMVEGVLREVSTAYQVRTYF